MESSESQPQNKAFMEKVITFVQFLVALIILLIILLVVWIIYRMFTKTYYRPFVFGHTEPLEDFMIEYISDIAQVLNHIKNNPSDFDQAIVKVVNDMATREKRMAKSFDKQYLYGNIFTSKEIDEITPNELPYIYAFYIFRSNPTDKGTASMLPTLMPNSTWAQSVKEYVLKNNSLPTQFADDLAKVEEDIMGLIRAIPKDTKNIYMKKLQIIFSKDYDKTITRMYDFRKSGGVGNMKLFVYLMSDYLMYIFNPEYGVVPRGWGATISDTKSTVKRMELFMTSPAARDYMMRFPAKIAGIEEFINLLPPRTSVFDTVEHLGFLKPLIEIPKFFKMLGSVAKALATAVASPIKACQILLGLILGTLIYLIYAIISAVTILYYAPAFVYVIFMNLLGTGWWIFLFVFVSTWYLLIWLIDLFTGGAIMRAMRCENVPSAWYKRPGYFFNNKYMKAVFCHYPCASKFIPSTNNSWCDRIPLRRPHYCPQQLLYMAAEAVIGNGSPPQLPSLYKFFIPPDYYTLTDEQKKEKLKEFFDDKKFYLEKCKRFKPIHDKASLYDEFAITACDFFTEQRKKQTQLYNDNSTIIDNALKLCNDAYCVYTYQGKKNKASAVSKPAENKSCPFCKELNKPEDIVSSELDEEEGNVLLAKAFLYSIIIFVVIIIIVVLVYFYASDYHFNFASNFFKSA